MSPRVRCTGEDGSAGVSIELMATLIILFLPVILMTGTGVMWFQRYTAAQDLAADVARVIVTAPAETGDPRPASGEYDLPLGQRLARVDAELPELIDDYRLDPADVAVTYNLADLPSEYRRGEALTVTVTVTAPGITLPFVGSFASRDLTADHTERIDQHRSITRCDLPGYPSCP